MAHLPSDTLGDNQMVRRPEEEVLMSTHVSTNRTVAVRRRRGWPRPTISSALAAIVGVVLLVIAIVALARTGIPADDLTSPAVVVGPFVRTPLFALIELVIGLVALATAADGDVQGASVFAVVSGVFGIVWLIEPGAFESALGVTVATGWLYVVFAATLLVSVAADRFSRA